MAWVRIASKEGKILSWLDYSRWGEPYVGYTPMDNELWGHAITMSGSGLTIWNSSIRNSSTEHRLELYMEQELLVSMDFTPRYVKDYDSNNNYNSVSKSGPGRTFNSSHANKNFKLVLSKYEYQPPSTPSNINVPSQIKEGEIINISWGTSSLANSYTLERSINGGSYSQIYSGTNRNYTDTALPSWNTVTYRVRGYNVDGYSSYRTSDTIIVTHFPEMSLKISGALKTSEMGWVKVDGELKEIDSIYTKINGVLKEVE